MQLKEEPGQSAENADEIPVKAETPEVEEEIIPESTEEPQRVTDEPKDQSPVGIMQRWLNAIRQGREHV